MVEHLPSKQIVASSNLVVRSSEVAIKLMQKGLKLLLKINEIGQKAHCSLISEVRGLRDISGMLHQPL